VVEQPGSGASGVRILLGSLLNQSCHRRSLVSRPHVLMTPLSSCWQGWAAGGGGV